MSTGRVQRAQLLLPPCRCLSLPPSRHVYRSLQPIQTHSVHWCIGVLVPGGRIVDQSSAYCRRHNHHHTLTISPAPPQDMSAAAGSASASAAAAAVAAGSDAAGQTRQSHQQVPWPLAHKRGPKAALNMLQRAIKSTSVWCRSQTHRPLCVVGAGVSDLAILCSSHLSLLAHTGCPMRLTGPFALSRCWPTSVLTSPAIAYVGYSAAGV